MEIALVAFASATPTVVDAKKVSSSVCVFSGRNGRFFGDRKTIGVNPTITLGVKTTLCSAVVREGNSSFDVYGRFYQGHSKPVRDLGVLAANILSKSRLNRRLRVLDACCGSGVRSLRYLREAPVDFVWANDAQTSASDVVERNLMAYTSSGKARVTVSTLEDVISEIKSLANSPTAAGKVLWKNSDNMADTPAGLSFDLVDLDMFGACSCRDIGLALDVINRSGGLLYVSSTDSVSAAGRNPDVARRAWASEPKWLPSVNEQFLRLVLGACAKAAAERNLEIKPVFSYFHGPSSSARLMVRVKDMIRRAEPSRRKQEKKGHLIGYLGYCKQCGCNSALDSALANNATDVAQVTCTSCGAMQNDANDFVLSGPLWIGRLHNPEFLREMRALASRFQTKGGNWLAIRRIISQLLDESLQPPQYYDLGDLGKKLHCSLPPRQRITEELARRGYSSSSTHCRSKCLKTNAPYDELLTAIDSATKAVEAMAMAASAARS